MRQEVGKGQNNVGEHGRALASVGTMQEQKILVEKGDKDNVTMIGIRQGI